MGGVVSVFPLYKAPSDYALVRGQEVQRTVRRHSSRNVYASGGRARNGLGVSWKDEDVEHAAPEGQTDEEEWRQDHGVWVILGRHHAISPSVQGILERVRRRGLRRRAIRLRPRQRRVARTLDPDRLHRRLQLGWRRVRRWRCLYMWW